MIEVVDFLLPRKVRRHKSIALYPETHHPENPLPRAKDFISGVKNRIEDDRLSMVAASVAFYIFLSIFPMLTVIISVYGLALEPQLIQSHIKALGSFVPKDVLDVLSTRIKDLASTQDQHLTLGVIGGILVSLWSANKAMKSVAKALNIAYDAKENRGVIKFNVVTLALTLASSIAFIIALLAIVFVPILVNTALAARAAGLIMVVGSWAGFALVLTGVFLMIYRYAPALHLGWRDLLPGAAATAVLFIIASVGFSLYVGNFGEYDKQYGALGAVVVTMLWLYFGTFIFLLGAEIITQLYRIPETGNKPASNR